MIVWWVLWRRDIWNSNANVAMSCCGKRPLERIRSSHGTRKGARISRASAKSGLRPPTQDQHFVIQRGRPSAARLSEMIAVIKERFRICSFCKRSTATLLREHIWRCCIKNGNSCYTSIYIYIYVYEHFDCFYHLWENQENHTKCKPNDNKNSTRNDIWVFTQYLKVVLLIRMRLAARAPPPPY